jgi:carboxyl-terminal processing protease
VKQLLKELNAAQVQGVVMDLRDNGGGSLQDVVKMVGLFVSNGPIVQVRGRDQTTPMSAYDTNVVFRGPLIVLVNGGSASASEIFAAAIQDYKRGIIMGSQTYGKGTVQQMFNLDDYINPQFKDLTPLGSVKITISKFYRINGGTTQKDGVTPDVPMPDAFEYLYPKEKDEDCPIISDKIKPVAYSAWNNPPNINTLQHDFEQITDNDSIFQLIHEQAIQYKKQRDKTMYTLNLDEYRKEENAKTETDKKFEAITKPMAGSEIWSPDGKPLGKPVDSSPQLAGGTAIYAIYPIGQEAQEMKADTSEVKTENTRLRQITKDHELYLATRLINEMK